MLMTASAPKRCASACNALMATRLDAGGPSNRRWQLSPLTTLISSYAVAGVSLYVSMEREPNIDEFCGSSDKRLQADRPNNDVNVSAIKG